MRSFIMEISGAFDCKIEKNPYPLGMFFSFSSRFFLLCILTFSISANLVFADTLNKEATFYADSLE